MPSELLAGDDHVVAIGRYTASAKATGKPLDVPFAHVWKFAAARPCASTSSPTHAAGSRRSPPPDHHGVARANKSPVLRPICPRFRIARPPEKEFVHEENQVVSAVRSGRRSHSARGDGVGRARKRTTQRSSKHQLLEHALDRDARPLTGGAGFIGQEQLSWAKLAIATLPKTMGLKVKLVQGDAPAEQGPSAAQTVAQKFIANKNLVGVIGGSTSGSVAATSKAFNQAGILQISSSATRTTLTKGDNQEATKSFFRVIPADDYQGPTDAKYMIDVLKVKNVAIIDFQEPYSQGLARRGREGAQGRGCDDVASVDPEHRDRLLVVRHEGSERRRHRVLPVAEAR